MEVIIPIYYNDVAHFPLIVVYGHIKKLNVLYIPNPVVTPLWL